MFEPLICEDCGGQGVDPGSLSEPERCQCCLGSGKQRVELDTGSFYGKRKPIGRALPQPITAGELADRQFRLGGVG
jgi:hypothetical protein